MYEQQHLSVLYISIPLGVGPELCELRRIFLPRTPVNKGKKRKGRGLIFRLRSLLLPLFTEVRGIEILGSSHSSGPMLSGILMYRMGEFRCSPYIRN